MKLYIPAWHYRARAIVQRTWGWSPIEEMVLLRLDQSPGSIESVASGLAIADQIVSATVARLMQFGLVEVQMSPTPRLTTSTVGRDFINSDYPLPERTCDRELNVSIVYEKVGQSVFRRRDVTIRPTPDATPLDGVISFAEDDIPETDATMADKVSRFVAGSLRPGEWMRGVQTINSVLKRQYLVLDLDKTENGQFPERASEALISALSQTSSAGTLPKLAPRAPKDPISIETTFAARNLIFGGSAHLDRFEEILDKAERHIFVLSTFVASQTDQRGREQRERVWRALERACDRGVHCHLFFGTSTDKRATNAAAMEELRVRLMAGSLRRGFLFVHRDSVRSHAKFLAADDGTNGAVVVMGSCNWLSSPFAAQELSAEMRESDAVAIGLDLLRSIVASLSDASRTVEALQFMASELRRTKSNRRSPDSAPANARLTVLYAPDHERLLRKAAHEAQKRFICCTNRMGSAMVPGLFTPAEIAGRRLDDVRVLFSLETGPTKPDHIATHRKRLENVVDVIQVEYPRLHCKFLLWDDDHVVVSTLNWGSQSGVDEKPLDELGIHLEGPQLASALLEKLETAVPKVAP